MACWRRRLNLTLLSARRLDAAAGLSADVRPVERGGDLTTYQSVVLGSAVYMGQWCGAAATFLKRNEQALARQAVWIFSSGPTVPGEAPAFLHGLRLPGSLQPVADRIRPRDIAVFHGAVDLQQLGLFEKFIMKKSQSPLGDFRNWDAIAAWAAAIARGLQAKEAVAQ